MALDTVGFYVTSRNLVPGSIIQPGNWGTVIKQYGKAHLRYADEMRFEEIRDSEFPSKPSRLTSNFLCARREDADWYQQAAHPDDAIYEVAWDQELDWHQGCILLLDKQDGMTLDQRARHYWAFDHGISVDGFVPYEIVTQSPMRIVQVLGQP
ncbi:hypothetical protein J2Y48_002478 [Mycoplana sp. BE70]|uniref:hypothetical protein n=1 Tax=Mycoplana sp. BE70 TaxID=2817775 RepID=UPI0028662BDE|nr:hypothetical protein [Mycoplana sp. BE70]MDR6757182.1 hypothetical protein [Mycoplana sp. BE70]